MRTSTFQDFTLEKFDSIEEFDKMTSTREVNEVFKDAKLASVEGTEDFTMTKTFEEAVKIMQRGYKDGLDQLHKAGKVKVNNPHVTKQLPKTGIVGFTPHVPNAIAGIPQSMISTERVQMKSKVISIIYNNTCSCGVSAESIAKAGRNLLDLIVNLESKGYRVQLEILVSNCTSQQQVGALIKVKDHRQHINPLKLAYLLVHPSFFRRHTFRWLETMPGLKNEEFVDGYGYALHNFKKGVRGSKEYLSKLGVLKQGEFFTNVNQGFEADSAEELGRMMGILSTPKK